MKHVVTHHHHFVSVYLLLRRKYIRFFGGDLKYLKASNANSFIVANDLFSAEEQTGGNEAHLRCLD